MSSIVIAGDTSGTCTLQAANVAGNTVLNLPTTSGTLVSSGSIPAAGSTTQVQYNNAGAFAGSSSFVFDGTNVGIGTSSPSVQLQINSGAATYSDQLRVRNTNFGNADIGVGSGIMALATDMSNMAFYTSSSLGTTGSALPTNERMRITSAGDVGIGTSSPASKLDVSSSSVNGANIALNKTNSGTANQNGQLINFYNYGPAATGRNAGTLIGGFYFGCSQPSSGAIQDAGAISCVAESQSGNNTASALAFSTNTGNSGNAERMRITSDGLLQFNSGYGSVATAYGCRAWVNFNGTGTVAIRGSGNVSSITDNGTGNYTVNFTTAMPDVNYCPVAMTSGDADIPVLGANRSTYPISSASSCPVRNYRTTDNSLQDQVVLCVGFFR